MYKHKYFLDQYKYHYISEYPLNLFIKDKKLKKTTCKKYNQLQKNKISLTFEDKKEPNFILKLKNNYYRNYKDYVGKNPLYKNGNIYDDLIKNNDSIILYNVKQILIYYQIFNNFLEKTSIEINKIVDPLNNLYNNFKKYKKDNFPTTSFGNDSLLSFYKKIIACYNIINYLDNKPNTESIIKLFYMMELNTEIIKKIYKLNNNIKHNFMNFLNEKYNNILKGYLEKNNCLNENLDEKTDIRNKICNLKIIKKICNNIPINYIGSKKNLVKTILNKINNIKYNKFIEMFGGSLSVSFVLKKLNPDIEIIAYDNNRLLMNFYEVLKNSPDLIIKNIIEIIKELKISNDRVRYIKEIIKKVNYELNNKDFSNNLKIASYYYILNKISYRGVIKYNKNGNISMSVYNSKINSIIKFNEKHISKMYIYSNFLNNIKLKRIDVMDNYNEILKYNNKYTMVYVDPPYDSNNNYSYIYQNVFNKDSHITLNMILQKLYIKGINWIKSNEYTGFISELYHSYNKYVFQVKNKITNSIRSELLITSF